LNASSWVIWAEAATTAAKLSKSMSLNTAILKRKAVGCCCVGGYIALRNFGMKSVKTIAKPWQNASVNVQKRPTLQQ
jgi:hypothetical protein